jgi:DNA-binding HxlR family transcriptional regulator
MMYGRQIMSERPEAGTVLNESTTRSSPIDALEDAAAVLGRRWKLAILFLLTQRRYRYNAMMRELPGATPKMLTQQLRSLEDEGLVVRYEYAGGAKHTEYALSTVGEQFVPVVEALNDWVSRHWRRPGITSDAREQEHGTLSIRAAHRAD